MVGYVIRDFAKQTARFHYREFITFQKIIDLQKVCPGRFLTTPSKIYSLKGFRVYLVCCPVSSHLVTLDNIRIGGRF